MPFPDEVSPDGVVVLPYEPSWASEAAAMITRLQGLAPDALTIEHIGSTSIPGMAAKPCIDLMIVVADLDRSPAAANLTAAGFRRRPEPWNDLEPAGGRDWPKLVFAPPVGGRSCNIHLRPEGAATITVARLFRSYLLAHPGQVELWSEFKLAIADVAPDLAAYGRIKAPAWQLLMECAGHWAENTADDLDVH